MSMWYEVARALVQRIFQDKILLGLVIVGILGIFMTGISSNDEPAPASSKADAAAPEAGAGTQERPAAGQAPAQPIEPNLAVDFVKWWLGGAMDYTAATAAENHNQAFGWMTPEAQRAFQAAFWSAQTAEMVKSGQLVAAFHLAAVQAEAINPDGSIVVGVAGTLVTDTGGRPVTNQVNIDFLVRREQDGLRVAGIYNRISAVPGPSVY